LIKETEFVRDLQGIRESQFAQGNGYIGTRGIYEEIPYDCAPGTYIAGVYDKMTAQVSELVNLPNPVNFKFTVEGEKISVIAMDIAEHNRILNTNKGLLSRRTLYQDRRGRRYNYQSLRFISQHNKNIGAMQIALTPLDAGCLLDIATGIDTSVSNAGVLSEGRKKHFRIRGLGQYRNAGYLITETFEKKYIIVYWAGFYYHLDGKKVAATDNIFQLRLKKKQTVIFTKIFCIKHYPWHNDHQPAKRDAYAIFAKAFRMKFSSLLQNHIEAWARLWKRADILIEGTANLQQNLRFNIYHMLSCAHYDRGFSSIGARTLSGEGYRGHVFWDAEVFLLPFFLFTFPGIAKNMLLYRYRCLGAARRLARSNGYKGAQFAWESADSGEEETPEWARDLDRTVIKIQTHKMEHHITADIAYATYKYYVATGDEAFMKDYGYELLCETARFWVSRLSYNKKKKRYEIKGVIGPDEFHINVDNNAYTNMMAKWNLLTAHRLCTALRKKSTFYKALLKKLDLRESEIGRWRTIASSIYLPMTDSKIIEQFSGYFKLKRVTVTRTDENGIPLIPASLAARDLGKTQLIKQPDVLMLLHMLDDAFSRSTKKINYDYYSVRTVHKSSLSAPVQALSASYAGDLQKAYMFFNVALRTDISNLYGNTSEGIHAASLGGTWQALVFGFAGVTVKKETLHINPRMPHSWRKIVLCLCWRKALIRLALTNEIIEVKIHSKKVKTMSVAIYGKTVSLAANKRYRFRRSAAERKKEEYY